MVMKGINRDKIQISMQDFPGLVVIFQDFPVLENAKVKFQDFPGPIQTLPFVTPVPIPLEFIDFLSKFHQNIKDSMIQIYK